MCCFGRTRKSTGEVDVASFRVRRLWGIRYPFGMDGRPTGDLVTKGERARKNNEMEFGRNFQQAVAVMLQSPTRACARLLKWK